MWSHQSSPVLSVSTTAVLCRLCPSYPQQLLVPAWITDKELENVATFRSWKRIPAVVYRLAKTGFLPHHCGFLMVLYQPQFGQSLLFLGTSQPAATCCLVSSNLSIFQPQAHPVIPASSFFSVEFENRMQVIQTTIDKELVHLSVCFFPVHVYQWLRFPAFLRSGTRRQGPLSPAVASRR